MQEMWVQSLRLEDPLEKAMTAHSSILAWRIPWTEESGGLQSLGLQSQDLETKQQNRILLAHSCSAMGSMKPLRVQQ